MKASPPAPWDVHEIKPAGPPQYYHAKSVLYRRCADQDACMNKEGPYSPFLEGVKAQQSLRYANTISWSLFLGYRSLL